MVSGLHRSGDVTATEALQLAEDRPFWRTIATAGRLRLNASRHGDDVLTATLMLQCCVRLSVVCNVCIVPERCVIQHKLLLTAYRKSYMRNRLVYWYQNE